MGGQNQVRVSRGHNQVQTFKVCNFELLCTKKLESLGLVPTWPDSDGYIGCKPILLMENVRPLSKSSTTVTARWIDRQTDKQTDRQTDGQTDRRTDG